ncbi:hypothetical protein GH714_023739 [Hevea brasiliensis]|uniref:30S ribosomal protein S21 n=1 Tax=Hevea brasiliensis TaxID=3981 RepID=A0A6A6MK71_HEVBR|nr:hypothetical protein GH714_023739 [Hevea brasiliensis]
MDPTSGRINPTPSFISLTTAGDSDILSVVCPSLAYAKTLHFKSGFNVQINVEENEPEDRILLRFRRAVMKAGILQECKRRRFFESSHDKKKRKARDAARRNRKRHPRKKAQGKKEAPKKEEKYNDEDDNWELPEGELPYC